MTISDKKKIIESDFNFIWRAGLKLFTGAFVVENFTKAWERDWAAGGEAGWIGALLVALFYSIADLTYGLGGIVIFIVNIIFLGASIVLQNIGEAVVDVIRWLYFWCD